MPPAPEHATHPLAVPADAAVRPLPIPGADADGLVRIAIGANDFGHGHWLDTGGRHRGFVVFRWLDNPDPPKVTVTLRGGATR